MSTEHISSNALPGDGLRTDRMPGHWLLARLGKRVLRPGGLETTRRMLEALAIGEADDVVEFAPGLGVTAALTLKKAPRSYTAVDRDNIAAKHVSALLRPSSDRCVIGNAESSGLPDESASVVYGEAMLSMQTDSNKQRIIAEAARILKKDGRYGIHEVCLCPDDISDDLKENIKKDLTGEIRVGVRPLTAGEWITLLELEGLQIQTSATSPFHLLEPARLLRDEGLLNTMRILLRLMRDSGARRRALAMRRVLKKHQQHVAAIMITAIKTAS